MRRVSALILGAAVSWVVASQAEAKPVTVTETFQESAGGYVGTQDTWVSPQSPTADTAHGTEPDFEWDINNADPSNQHHALLRFDNIIGPGSGMIPQQSEIISATVELEVFDRGSGVSIHRMLVPWNELSTWNSLVAGVSADGVEAVATPDDVAGMPTDAFNVPLGPLTLDVTESIRSWAGDGQPMADNHGWTLLPLTPGGLNAINVRSSEFGTVLNRPLLTIVFNPSATALPITPEPSTIFLWFIVIAAAAAYALCRRRKLATITIHRRVQP